MHQPGTVHSEQHADQPAHVLQQQQAALARQHVLAQPISSSSHILPLDSGQWCRDRGHLLLLSLLLSQAGWRLRWWLQITVNSEPSFSAVWRGQAEREQQQAKQLEQQLRETQGSTQTLEQQASSMHASREGGWENPAGIQS